MGQTPQKITNYKKCFKTQKNIESFYPTGWLEPMAQRIKDNPKTVTIPMIDSISDRTLEFYGHPGGISVSVGAFTW